MNNKEILEHLLERGIEEDYSVNALNVMKYLPQWDTSEEFPVNELERYIRFNEWTKNDLIYSMELVVTDYLPNFCLDIFFEMKEFRSNSRNELLSTQEVFAKLYGYPYDTQDEKALCIYKYALQEYYNDSKIIRKE